MNLLEFRMELDIWYYLALKKILDNLQVKKYGYTYISQNKISTTVSNSLLRKKQG